MPCRSCWLCRNLGGFTSARNSDPSSISRLTQSYQCLCVKMSRHSISHCLTVSNSSLRTEAPPIFLAPSLARGNKYSFGRAQFSTSTPLLKRRKWQKRDPNPDRGVSALRRTGLRHPVSMSKVPLPQPVDPSKRDKHNTAESHRLHGFFNMKRVALSTPEEDEQHGMGRSVLLPRIVRLTL